MIWLNGCDVLISITIIIRLMLIIIMIIMMMIIIMIVMTSINSHGAHHKSIQTTVVVGILTTLHNLMIICLGVL
jgi:hypothetical protein